MPIRLDPATVLRLVLEIGDADLEHDWYLTSLVPMGDDPGHVEPDPMALTHLNTAHDLVGLFGWGLYKDEQCVAVYLSDNSLHREGRFAPVYDANSIWEAVALCIDAISPVLPSGF